MFPVRRDILSHPLVGAGARQETMWYFAHGCHRRKDGAGKGGLTQEPLTALVKCSVVREGCFSFTRSGAA